MIESAFEGKKSMLESASEGKKSMFGQCFRALSGLKARSRNDFECSAASKENEACSKVLPMDFEAHSSSDFERSVASKETEACSSTDFERSVASKHVQRPLRQSKKQARAVISRAQWLRSKLEQ